MFDRKNIYPGDPAFDFCAEVGYVTETKLRAVLEEDADEWVGAWYEKYLAAGKPKQLKKWLLEQLKNEFLSMGEPPKWLNMDNAHWPFHKDRPMVFISQIPLKTRPETEKLILDEEVIYLFAISDIDEIGCNVMVCKEVVQFPC